MANQRAVKYTTFCTYWRKLLPHVVIAKPRTDLCWTCQQNSAAIMKAINRPDNEKSEVVYSNGVHLCVCVCAYVCMYACAGDSGMLLHYVLVITLLHLCPSAKSYYYIIS